MPLPGSHATCNVEPQFSAMKHLLRACLDENLIGDLQTCNPSDVFDRQYQLQISSAGELLLDGAGRAYPISTDDTRGCIEIIAVRNGYMAISGWATEADQQPAQSIVVFLHGHYLGYGASGVARPDLAVHAGLGVEHAGFYFVLPTFAAQPWPRLFVLAGGQHAVELTYKATVRKEQTLFNEIDCALDRMRRLLFEAATSLECVSHDDSRQISFKQWLKDHATELKVVQGRLIELYQASIAAEAIYSSTVWKITAPVRRVAEKFPWARAVARKIIQRTRVRNWQAQPRPYVSFSKAAVESLNLAIATVRKWNTRLEGPDLIINPAGDRRGI